MRWVTRRKHPYLVSLVILWFWIIPSEAIKCIPHIVGLCGDLLYDFSITVRRRTVEELYKKTQE